MLEIIDHIGIAVKSIDRARRFYEQGLGMCCAGEEVVEGQLVRIAWFTLGATRIELLEPTSPDSPVARFLEKRGEGIHHLAYRCDDIRAQLDRARAAGLRLIDREPVRGAGDRLVAFLHPATAHGVLTELCQRSGKGEDD